MKYIKKIINSIVIMSFTFLLVACGGKKIEPDKFINVIPYGAEGYGSVATEVNHEYYDQLLIDIVNPKKGQNVYEVLNGENVDEQTLNNVAYIDNIDWKVEGENKNLKNGDTVKITFSVPEHIAEKSKVKLSKDSFEFKVKDLKEAIVFDPFEKFEIKFDGNDGYGKLTSNEPELPVYGKFVIPEEDKLSNGDKIKVTFDYDEQLSLQSGYVAKSKEKEFTVKGLKELKVLKSSELFDGIKLNFENASPFLKATIENKLDSKYRDNIDIQIKKDGNVESDYFVNNLKIGDKLILFINDSESLQNVGYKIDNPNATKEIILDEKSAPQYAKDISKLNKDQATEIKNQALDTIKTAFSNVSLYDEEGVKIVSYKNHKLEEVNLVTPKQGMLEEQPDEDSFVNELVLIFSADTEYENGTIKKGYIGTKLPNIITETDGKYTYDLAKVEHMIFRSGSGFFGSKMYSFESIEKFKESFYDPIRKTHNISNVDLKLFN